MTLRAIDRQPVYRELRGPIYAQLELTSACNERCVHCYNAWQTSDVNRFMTQEQVERCVAQFSQHRLVQVVATGGEPTLASPLLLRLAEGLRSAGIRLSLNTNLICMSRDLAASLKRAGLRSVLTSFVSVDEGVHDLVTRTCGTHPRIVSGIRCVLEQGFRLGVNMVVTRHNWTQVYATAEFLVSLGVKSMSVTKGSPPLNAASGYSNWALGPKTLLATLDDLDRARQDFGIEIGILECYPLCFFPNDARYRVFAGHRCTAGVTTCTVGVDGQVRPCSHADMPYGSLFDEDLAAIWRRMRDWRAGAFLPDRCVSCEYFSRCTGGCRMEAKYCGDIRGMDPWADPERTAALEELFTTPSPILVDEDARFRLKPGVLLRREDWGWVVSAGPSSTYLVTVEAGNMLQRLRDRTSFAIREVAEEHGIQVDEAMAFFGRLRLAGGILSQS